MNTSTRRAAATAAASVALSAAVVAAPSLDAAAATRPRSHITVHPSDTRVASGEEFVLRGRLTTRQGEPIENGRVRVAARYPDGDWDNLSGAVVSTNSEGRYRVRVVLTMTGNRDLRVVGNPPGDRVRVSRAYTPVRVTA
jgi:hypothetical protein